MPALQLGGVQGWPGGAGGGWSWWHGGMHRAGSWQGMTQTGQPRYGCCRGEMCALVGCYDLDYPVFFLPNYL